ncbi:aldehyde dehydrogenase family protein [Pseudomonas sichuanensis]|uniref:aldehyde dehydrogenase family protein n=1 Tax=Pseudomonas sichuanensis TaxID=2213015 RepID=UPI0035A5AF69
MVVKPSQETPLHAFVLAEMIEAIGLPAGVFNLVSGPGSKVGEALARHPLVDMGLVHRLHRRGCARIPGGGAVGEAGVPGAGR